MPLELGGGRGGGRGGGGGGRGGGRGPVPPTEQMAALSVGEPEAEQDLPPRLAHRIMATAASQHKWPVGSWRFDGRKNLFLPGQVCQQHIRLPPIHEQ